MKIYFKYFAFIILLTFSLSCARGVPQIWPKKRPPKVKKKVEEKVEKKIEKKKPRVVKKPEKKKRVRKRISPKFTDLLPTYFNKKDSSDMALVRQGEFVMGDNRGEKNEKPATKVFVSDFYIDIYEITNQQYRFYDKKNLNNTTATCELCPATGISWGGADSYCKWANKRLPTEAEWEKAARGTQRLKWPWGNTPQKNKANILEPAEPGSIGEHNTGPVPVGSFPEGASVFGVLDMAGNVWEWTSSYYNPYKKNTDSDIRYREHYKVLRGGSWKNILENSRTTYRHPVPADTRLQNIGFRCAKNVKSPQP